MKNRYLHGPVIGQVFADENAIGDVLWPLQDNQQTVRDVVQYDAGEDETTVVQHIQYDSFGLITDVSNTAVPIFFAYTGRIWDADVQLYNYRARWYDPHTHTFISPDPLRLDAGDTNFYRYVGNNPVNYSDPSGLLAVATGGDLPETTYLPKDKAKVKPAMGRLSYNLGRQFKFYFDKGAPALYALQKVEVKGYFKITKTIEECGKEVQVVDRIDIAERYIEMWVSATSFRYDGKGSNKDTNSILGTAHDTHGAAVGELALHLEKKSKGVPDYERDEWECHIEATFTMIGVNTNFGNFNRTNRVVPHLVANELKSGEHATVAKMVVHEYQGTVHNFAVRDLHCYAVGASQVLVHNNSGDIPGIPNNPLENEAQWYQEQIDRFHELMDYNQETYMRDVAAGDEANAEQVLDLMQQLQDSIDSYQAYLDFLRGLM